MIVLAADVGGTKARVALVDVRGDKTQVREVRVYPSATHESLEAILRDFVRASGTQPAAACLGVPGPIHEGRATITNLPWVVEDSELSLALNGAPVVLLNDLEAAGWGVAALSKGEQEPIVGGAFDQVRSALLVFAGTGLGVSHVLESEGILRARASEGGHMALAPHDERTERLAAWLRARFGRASWERVVSGPGLVNVFRFLVEHEDLEATRELRVALEAGALEAELVSQAGLAGRCEASARAVEIVVHAWGAFAGDLALALLPDVVYLGGGLAPGLISALRGRRFEQAFRGKGRLAPAIERVPVRALLVEDLGLRGAARRAAILASEMLP